MNKSRRSQSAIKTSTTASKRLLEIAGHASSIEEAISLIGEAQLRGVKCPPTDLDLIAKRNRISAIIAEDLPVSGELRRDGKDFQIAYSSYLSEPKRRFTVAHEIAHAIFENNYSRPPRSGVELERLCDLMASELLMPQDIFRSLAGHEPSISRLLKLARTFKTSLAATSIRYAKLLKVSVFYLDDGRILWGSGIIRGGSVSSQDYALRLALTSATDRAKTETILLTERDWTGEWLLEYHPFSNGCRALCMLRPNRAKPSSLQPDPATAWIRSGDE